MKKASFYLIIFALLITLKSSAQCYPDRHNTSWFEGWISCETSENPNSERGFSHWISYDFGQIYALNELKIWNVNDPDLLSFGAKNVIIDYSTDGKNWIEYGQETFPKANGISTYEGDLITNLNGIEAQHLLITVLDNYGGECSGISEFRVSADSIGNDNEDICIIAETYPNPFKDEFSIELKKKCLGEVFFAIEDATGRTVISEQTIKLNEKKQILTQGLAPGVYFVALRNGEIKQRYKIVKN